MRFIGLVIVLLWSQFSWALSVVDNTGRTLTLEQPAQRIISLAPHITENLFSAGLGDKIVGSVSYSDYPEKAKSIPRIGTYKAINIEQIIALKPDVIIAWHSGNIIRQIEKLESLGIPIFYSEPRNLDDIAVNIERMGSLGGTSDIAQKKAQKFRQTLAQLKHRYQSKSSVKTLYQVWNNPLMSINQDHFISKAIEVCGGVNVFADAPTLVPQFGLESIIAKNPEVIIAGTMPKFRQTWSDGWQRWTGVDAVKNQQLYFLTGDHMQRPTFRALKGIEELCGYIDKTRTAKLKINNSDNSIIAPK
jgi:iron complex transport system substrate-binding protein